MSYIPDNKVYSIRYLLLLYKVWSSLKENYCRTLLGAYLINTYPVFTFFSPGSRVYGIKENNLELHTSISYLKAIFYYSLYLSSTWTLSYQELNLQVSNKRSLWFLINMFRSFQFDLNPLNLRFIYKLKG